MTLKSCAENVMEGKMFRRLRDHKLEYLISKLADVDPEFVNHSFYERKYYSDKQLLKHFRRIYRKSELMVDVDDAEKGAMVHVTYSYLKQQHFSLTHKSKGIVKSLGPKVGVVWGPKIITQVDDHQLVVCGRKGNLLRKEKTYPETRGDYFKLKKGDLVRYTGDESVMWIYNPSRNGVWGTVVNINKNHEIISVQLDENVVVHSPIGSLKRLVKNEIDFERLYEECYK